MKETEVLIPEVEDFGIRIDKFLAERVDLTRSALQKLIENGMVTISGKPINKNHIIKTGDIIYVNIPEPEFSSIEPEDISLNIIYEDSAIIVVNKQKGMVVHPAPGNYSGTLVNALLYHCGGSLSGINGVIRPGIVHRIDKDTSGLLIVAKTDAAHVNLALQIQAHTFERIYHAVVIGNLKNDSGTINAPIGRHKTDRKKMAVTTDGRSAVTHYKVIERFNKFTYVELKLETGRTHQIRVHMASVGHPVLGDTVYGTASNMVSGQCLHAKTLGIKHPETDEYMVFDSELPEYFMKILLGGA